MVYGSVCSGIEAVTLAWEPLGLRARMVRRDRSVLLRAAGLPLFPMSKTSETSRHIGEDAGPIDVLVGGTPCVSFSIAGRRGGLDDPRGNLALEFCRLAGRLRPRWVVWENVPGVLSSHGGTGLWHRSSKRWRNLGYGCAWRVLDAQFFGVPQRRRRVFVVGHLGDWRRAAAVLLERESLRGNPPARRQAREEVAGALGGGSGVRGWCDDLDRAGAFVAHALNGKGGSGRMDGESETFVAHPLSGAGFDASEDGTGRGTPLVAAFSAKDHGADAGDLAPTLRAMPHDRSHANGGGQIAVCVQEGQTGVREYDTAGTVRSDAPGTQPGGSLIRLRMAVRRLMPRECERLQGLPDDWTLIPYRGKPAADGPRYRAIGNSMAVPVMRRIGRRMQMVEAICG